MLTLLCCHQSHRFVSLAASEHLHPLTARNTGVPFECLASSSVHAEVEWSDYERLALPLLIGQGQPWDEPQDSTSIYYTHASPSHQRECTSLISSTTSAISLLLSVIIFFSFFPCILFINSQHMHTQTEEHMLHPAWLLGEVLFVLCLTPESPAVLGYCFLLSNLCHTGTKITHFTSHRNIQHFNQQVSFNSCL